MAFDQQCYQSWTSPKMSQIDVESGTEATAFDSLSKNPSQDFWDAQLGQKSAAKAQQRGTVWLMKRAMRTIRNTLRGPAELAEYSESWTVSKHL